LDHSLQLLTTLAKTAETSGRNGRLIEILVLRSLALYKLGRTAQALEVLTRSLALAEPEGYVRIFLDEGRPMEELLQACNKGKYSPLKAYANHLLKSFKLASGRQSASSVSACRPDLLVEPLTEREMEVLHLLATGLSNRKIAEHLYLSEGTVKTHTHNLYTKMGVQSRTQAIARAQELKLV
jgi:LuxR family maltose regulon positive regulatory protein